MFKRLMVCAGLLCLTVLPVAAQIDPQSLLGVWEGSYQVRSPQGAQNTGSMIVTISKVEDGKVYGKSETMGARQNPPVNFVSNLTSTGYSHVTPAGHTSTTVVDGDTMRLSTTVAGGPVTAVMTKKK